MGQVTRSKIGAAAHGFSGLSQHSRHATFGYYRGRAAPRPRHAFRSALSIRLMSRRRPERSLEPLLGNSKKYEEGQRNKTYDSEGAPDDDFPQWRAAMSLVMHVACELCVCQQQHG